MLTIKCSNEDNLQVEFISSDTVMDLKIKIQTKLNDAPETQRLIFSGRVLKDLEPLTNYNITDGMTIHLVRARKPTATAPPAAAPVETARQSAPTPATALSFPGMMQEAGGQTPDLSAIMQNPGMQQMMAQMMQNPAFLQTMMDSNPQLAAMLTPEMRAMMSTPGFAAMMSNPALLGMMSGNASPGGGIPGARSPTDPSSQLPPLTNPLFSNPGLMNMLSGMGGGNGGGMPAPAALSGPPEEVYQVQLSQLRDMGFYDPVENVRALTVTSGNVEHSVEWLLNHPPPGRQ